MEAAYDVAQEAIADGKRREAAREAESLAASEAVVAAAAAAVKVEAAERRAERAETRAERGEASAKSMEAAYDVAMEAIEDGKRREAALLKRAEAAEAKSS